MMIGRKPQPAIIGYRPPAIPGMVPYVPFQQGKPSASFQNLDLRRKSMAATNKRPVSQGNHPTFRSQNLFTLNEGYGNIDMILNKNSTQVEDDNRQYKSKKNNAQFDNQPSMSKEFNILAKRLMLEQTRDNARMSSAGIYGGAPGKRTLINPVSLITPSSGKILDYFSVNPQLKGPAPFTPGRNIPPIVPASTAPLPPKMKFQTPVKSTRLSRDFATTDGYTSTNESTRKSTTTSKTTEDIIPKKRKGRGPGKKFSPEIYP